MAAGFFLALGSSLTAGVSVSPSGISNTYGGALDLTINGLNSAGQTVVVEEYFDSDASGTVTGPDKLLKKFQVTDGQVTSIAGQRNLNVPGDEDGIANSAITTRMLLAKDEIMGHISGAHVFQISPATAGFSPFSTTLTVTQQDYSGSGISGTITASGSGTPVAGALVIFFTGSDGEAAGITVSGADGSYSMKLPAGSYQVAAAKQGFVFNIGAAGTTTVPSGSFATGQGVVLNTAARTISGIARIETTLAPLTAVPIIGQSNSGFVAITLSDGSGNYVMSAAAEPCELQVDEMSLDRFGCLSTKFVQTGTTTVTGFNLDHPRGTSLIYGSLKTPANAPVPFARVEAETNGSPEYQSLGVTDANGNFALASAPGAWRVNSEVTGYLISEQTAVVNTTGSAVQQNLVANPVTSHLRGQIRNNSNNVVGNVVILAVEVTNGNTTGISARVSADSNGNFDLGVFGGGGTATKAWTLQLNQNDGPGVFVSTHPIFNVQDGVDINSITYVVYPITAHLRGQVLDESDSPISNVNVFANSNNGSLATGTQTDGGGHFDLGLFAASWQLGLSNIQGLGVIPQNNPTVTITNGVDQNGYVFRVRHATGTISGTVKNASNTPLGGVGVSGSITVSGATFVTTTTSAPDGTYSFPVFSGNWNVSLNAADLLNLGYNTPPSQNIFVTTSVPNVNFIASGGRNYSTFQTTYFTSVEIANPSISGLTANPSGDGVTNLLKYAFQLNPHNSIGSPALAAPSSPSGLPSTGILAGTGGPFATIIYRRLDFPTDLTYAVEKSSSLGGFATATVTEDILADDGTVQVVRAKVPMGANTRMFLRVCVTKTP